MPLAPLPATVAAVLEEAAMGQVRRFKSDTSGATAIVFALSTIPLMGFVGAAIDYSRAASLRSQVQRAVDGTALVLASRAGTLSEAELRAEGERTYRGYVAATPALTTTQVTVSRQGKTVRVAAAGSVKATASFVLGWAAIPVSSEAQVAWGTSRLEVALVLDNTGSMNDAPDGIRKIDALKAASKDLLSTLRAVAADDESVKVSIVPFDTEVRLDQTYRYESWLKWEQPHDRTAWTGYVVDRDQPYDTNPTAADPALPATLYPGLKHSQWASLGDLATVRPLTSLNGSGPYRDLTDTIDGMRPRGNTDLPIGLAWGLATLSPGGPLRGPAPSPLARKFVILLTDGDNTQNRVNGAINTTAGVIDARTGLACRSLKTAGVEVYAVRLIEGNAGLLRDCASDGDHYFDVKNPRDLSPVFRSIAREISRVRLTH